VVDLEAVSGRIGEIDGVVVRAVRHLFGTNDIESAGIDHNASEVTHPLADFDPERDPSLTGNATRDSTIAK
jgi:hypothetical protein